MKRLLCLMAGHRWAVVSFALPIQLRCLRCGVDREIPRWRAQ